jgi:hypothetical protein
MSVYNNLVGLIAVNNIGNGIGKAPANSTILVENFNNQTAVLDTPLNKYIDANVNIDGTSRSRGNIEDIFTEEQSRISPHHRVSFPIAYTNQERAIIDYDFENRKPALPKIQAPGIAKQINLREIVPINAKSASDFTQFNKKPSAPPHPDDDSIYTKAAHKPQVTVTPPLTHITISESPLTPSDSPIRSSRPFFDESDDEDGPNLTF